MRTIYYNGIVYTGDLPLVQAFAVEDGLFAATGSDADMLALRQVGDEVVDLHGRFVCCGFEDSHMHVNEYGKALGEARLDEHTDSLSEMLEYLRSFRAENPVAEGGWLLGRGWNQDYFTDCSRMPNRDDLDTVATDIPICIVRACGHCLVVNSKALELMGTTVDTVAPDGGTIGVENGRLDGRFYDNAMAPLFELLLEPELDEIMARIRRSCAALNSYGVTSCQTDDYPGCDWRLVNEAYRRLEASGELTVRVYEQCNFDALSDLREFVEAGNTTGKGSRFFRIGPLKLLGDGALGAHTAFLSRPYADDPSTCGLACFSQQELDEMIEYANDHGMQVAVHAIGDACLDRVLSAIERALWKTPRADHRHGIVHCQITRPDQLRKMIDMKLHIYAQSIFLDYDNHIVEQRVGKELARSSYNWKTLMDGGLSVSNGTDCPVELPFALGGIQCAVTRTSLRDHVGPYLPDQAFTVKEALDSYTIRSAEASFEETIKGRMDKGMLADFVVLDGNPFTAEEIQSIPVLATYVGGRCVYHS